MWYTISGHYTTNDVPDQKKKKRCKKQSGFMWHNICTCWLESAAEAELCETTFIFIRRWYLRFFPRKWVAHFVRCLLLWLLLLLLVKAINLVKTPRNYNHWRTKTKELTQQLFRTRNKAAIQRTLCLCSSKQEWPDSLIIDQVISLIIGLFSDLCHSTIDITLQPTEFFRSRTYDWSRSKYRYQSAIRMVYNSTNKCFTLMQGSNNQG